MKISFGRTTQPGIVLAVLLSVAAAGVFSCSGKRGTPALTPEDSAAIVQENIRHREEMDDFMGNSPDSPFRRDTSIAFHGLKWFPVNPYYRGRSVLHRYADPETVTIFGTKGEERRNLRYGYFEFDVPDDAGQWRTLRINVYKFTPHDKRRYELFRNHLSVWFTDKSTGKETYDVGRYVDIGEENPDPDFEYTVDLNKAYNPYCAYNDAFSCAIPRKEDHLDIALHVGEKKYRDDPH